MSHSHHLRALVMNEAETWIARFLPLIAKRSLQTGLHGIWARGDWSGLPAGGFVLAANHHSWWDLYLVWRVRAELKRAVTGLMHEETLERFPFFRRQGAIARTEVRTALRRLAGGDIVMIFPEGALRQAGEVRNVEAGLAFLARHAGVPVYPLAFRVVMRGAEKPEAFVVLGGRLEAEGLPTQFVSAINTLLAEVDAEVAAANPEAAPSGFEAWAAPAKRFDERLAWLKQLWP